MILLLSWLFSENRRRFPVLLAVGAIGLQLALVLALSVFGFRILPVIMVVCTLAALLWHWRILKWITKGFGFVFSRTMGLRGPTALAAAAGIKQVWTCGPRDWLAEGAECEFLRHATQVKNIWIPYGA